ncbi:MAG: DUF853 family protein [Candidatus Dormibacteraeota bacterium]|nr:DUF853 family protein [Candidatus Dormibacteraeota bacterium]
MTAALERLARSPWIPVRPTVAQAAFLACSEPEGLYAGTAASGKSTVVLMAALARMHVRGLAALVLVPTLSTSPLPILARRWLDGSQATWDAGARGWRFPGGATLTFAHRRVRLPGAYQFVGVDDLSEFTEDEYLGLFASLRAAPDMPAAVRAVSAPGEPGLEWIARRFGLVDGLPAPAGRRVIEASLEGNPHVDAAQVRRALAELPEPRRSWLLEGDWSAVPAVAAPNNAGWANDEDPRPVAWIAAPEPRDESIAGAPGGSISPAPSAPEARPRALLGWAAGREVWHDPFAPDADLANAHVAISGETGSGKTQAVKALVAQLREGGVAPVIVDFKDDYEGWATELGLPVCDPAAGGRLPFNPLVPEADRRTGAVNCLHQAHAVVDAVQRIWRLGDQQAFRLREALKGAYRAAGVQLTPFRPTAAARWPAFDSVRCYLEAGDPLLGRLSPILELDLFGAESGSAGLGGLLERGGVIRLAGLPGNEVKSATGEFLLLALYGHMLRQGHVRGLRWLLVQDECWRVATCPHLEPLLREGRAFGLGCVLASQYPRDLPLEVRGAAATQVLLGQTQLDQIAEIQRAVLGQTRGAGAERLARALRGLRRFHAVLHGGPTAEGQSRDRWLEVRLLPYFELSAGTPPPTDALPRPRLAFSPGLD